MDSKLKNVVVLITSLIVLTIVGVVFIINADSLKRRNERNAATNQTTAVTSSTVKLYEPDEYGFIRIKDDLYAWKNDESFFDSESSSLTAKLMEQMLTVSIHCVSVEKDLRIQVLDYKGNVKSGEAFVLKIRKTTGGFEDTYTDSDSDGVIYVADLEAGNYEVSLMPYEGLNVPKEAELVPVKESVEYLLIDDISLLMKNENDIDAEREDLMSMSAEDDADKKTTTTYATDTNVTYGIDVSSQNGDIEWDKVYKAGIRFVILRAGYRGAKSGELIVDSKFAENAKAASRAGLEVGAYFFSQAVNEVEAVEEASALVTLASGYDITYPLTIRIDRAGSTGRADEIDTQTRTLVAQAFCSTVKNMGYEPCVYASSKWLNVNLNSSKLTSQYAIWLAEYKKVPKYEEYYDMWQYSLKGKVSGISGNVALSLKYNN